EIKKININRVTFKELMAHPYFSYSTTKKIINFRDQHGDFRSVEEILENNLIKPQHYRKIAPYISIDKQP
ncbi:MAG: ComEA family DNA-binding protein, partial [Flavobacteriales bacterium]